MSAEMLKERAQLFVRAQLGEDLQCPCCTRKVKTYTRKLNSAMARGLLLFYRHAARSGKPNDYHLLRDVMAGEPRFRTSTGGGDFAKLRFWGLISERPLEQDQDQRTSGYWKMEQRGIDFVFGKIKVPSHVVLFLNEPTGFSEKTTTLVECFDEPFSYAEIMRSIEPPEDENQFKLFQASRQ